MRNFRKLSVSLTAVLASVTLALAGCSRPGGPEDTSGEKPRVLTTFTVIADMAQNVAGEYLDVQSITKPNQEIHEYQPTPDDIKRAEGAQLILNNGFGLERWFEKFVQNSPAKTVVVTDGIEPTQIGEGDYQGKPNPHAWMSPKAAETYIDNMVTAFSELDPEHADQFAANGAAYKEQIAAVGQKMTEELNKIPENQRVLVTCEGAFSYLARDMNLKEMYLWAVNAEGALTPRRVAEVEQYVKDNNVRAVFCESTVGDKMKPIVQSTDAVFGGILYVDSISDPDGEVPTYLDLLRYDAELITNGLVGDDER